MAAQAQNALSSSRVRSRRLPVPGSSAQARGVGFWVPARRSCCPAAVNSSAGPGGEGGLQPGGGVGAGAVGGGGEGGQDGEPLAGPGVHAGLGPGLLLLVLDVAGADGAGHGPRPPAGGVVQGPLGEVEVERPDDHQVVVGGLAGDGLLAAAGSADGPGPQALLPCGGDGGCQVQGADAGVVGFEVLPEARDQGRGQLEEGVVVDAGLALAQVVHEQVPDRPAGDAVPVDELLGGELPGELGADHPDGWRGGGRERPGGVQELVEERAGPPGAGAVAGGLPGAVQQLDAVAGGDVGDEAALGGHDHRDPLDRRVERGVPDGGLLAQLPQGRDPGGVPEPAHLVGEPGRGRRRQQPGKARADDVAADQLGHARPEPGVQARAQGAGRPAARRSATTWSRQSPGPPAPAPEESHRCCHVAPGCSSSQSRIFSMDSLRQCRALASPKANGAASSRRATVNRSAAVSGHDSGTGRGGNLASTAAAWALSCRAAVPAAAGAVTSGPSRTARPGSRAGNPGLARAGPAGARPAAGDGPAWPR